MLTKEQSKWLNQEISYVEAELTDEDDMEEFSHGSFCDNTNKLFPYIGWSWRDVDFTQPLTLGHTLTYEYILDNIPDIRKEDGKAKSVDMADSFFGFMENNKWGYWEKTLNIEDSNIIIAVLQKAVSHKHKRNFKIAFDVIQNIGKKYL